MILILGTRLIFSGEKHWSKRKKFRTRSNADFRLLAEIQDNANSSFPNIKTTMNKPKNILVFAGSIPILRLIHMYQSHLSRWLWYFTVPSNSISFTHVPKPPLPVRKSPQNHPRNILRSCKNPCLEFDTSYARHSYFQPFMGKFRLTWCYPCVTSEDKPYHKPSLMKFETKSAPLLIVGFTI